MDSRFSAKGLIRPLADAGMTETEIASAKIKAPRNDGASRSFATLRMTAEGFRMTEGKDFYTFPITRIEFLPPKPKESFIAKLILAGRALFGT